jgi:hypothetical protein
MIRENIRLEGVPSSAYHTTTIPLHKQHILSVHVLHPITVSTTTHTSGNGGVASPNRSTYYTTRQGNTMSLRYSLPAPMMRTRPSSKKNRTAAEVGKNKAAPDENPEESRVAAPPLSRPPKEMTPSAPLLFSAAHANEKHEEDGDFYSHGLRSLALHHHHPSDLPSGNDEKDRSSPFPPLLQSSNARVDDADDDDDALTIHYHPTLLSHRSHKSGRGLRKRKKSRRLASPRNNVSGSHMLPDIPEIDEGMSSDSTPPVTNVTEASVTPTHPCVPPPPLPSSPLQKSVASSPLPSSPIVAVHRRNGPLHSPTTILPGTNVPAQNDRNDDPVRFRLMELADDSLLDQSIPSAEVIRTVGDASPDPPYVPRVTSFHDTW